MTISLRRLWRRNKITSVVHGRFICNRWKPETTQMSISKWMDKQIVIHLYKKIPVSSKKSEILIYTITWRNLNICMLSQRSQTQKEYTLYGSTYIKLQKIQMNHGDRKEINSPWDWGWGRERSRKDCSQGVWRMFQEWWIYPSSWLWQWLYEYTHMSKSSNCTLCEFIVCPLYLSKATESKHQACIIVHL